MLFHSALTSVSAGAVSIMAKTDPNVTPNNNAPFLVTLRDVAGSIVMACLILAVIALVCGAAAFAFGKIAGNSRATEVGVSACMWVLFAAAVIGSASGLVFWSSGLKMA